MNEPLRVAQVLAGAPIGGAENFYTRLVIALADYPELTQQAFTRPNPAREQQLSGAGVPVARYRFGGIGHWLNNWRYRRALVAWQPDIVVTYMNRASALTPPGDYQLVARLGHYYDLKYYRHCDYWIGISQGICQHMIDGGLPAERIVHIPNFIDETAAAPLPRNSFNTDPDRPLLLAVGRLHVNKGFDTLISALSSVPEATLWLAGDGPERERLAALANRCNVADRVRFLGWRTDINALMRTADVFVCPSRHEGLGSIVPEAWFNQCPMVATASQGPAELIADGDTGLVTPIDDDAELARAINLLLADPARAAAMAERGREHYLAHYSKTMICQRYLDFFSRIAKSGRY